MTASPFLATRERDPLLGTRVRERYTKIDGTVVSITQHLYGEDQLGVCRDGVTDDGAPWPLEWFAVSRCEVAA